MSNTLNKCPDCNHRDNAHLTTKTGVCLVHNCPCTRTYESLVGENLMSKTEFSELFGQVYNIPDEEQMETETSLVLTVVDFGQTSIAYVEQGCISENQVAKWINMPGYDEGGIEQGDVLQFGDMPFADVRAAIDGEKPTPRLERTEDGTHFVPYTIHNERLPELDMVALITLQDVVGTVFPVYEPTGIWEEVGHINDDVYRNTDLRVWRYTR